MQNASKPLVLASGSPQRKNLLEQAGYEIEVFPLPFDEQQNSSLAPKDLVDTIAHEKLLTAKKLLPPKLWEEQVVVCSDTLVFLGNKPLGKPLDESQAKQMLEALSGHTHEVITSIALHAPGKQTATGKELYLQKASTTLVTFSEIQEDELQWYLNSREWQGAAGAYRIQGRGACLIQSIQGSYTGVVGLPLDVFYAMMRQVKIS